MSASIAIVLGLAAAIVFGVASVADQHSTKRVRSRQALSPRIFLDLARQPLWIASVGGTVIGFALQVLALRLGPLALVEPLLVCDLIFAVLINSYLRHRFDPKLLGGIVATAVGLAGFLVIAHPTSGTTSVGFLVVLPLAIGLAAGVAGCLAVARRRPDLRPLALALACGINYGVAAFLVKLVVSDTSGGLTGLLTDWPIYALAIVGPLGFLLNENAFQQGTLIAPVLAIITVCDPLISIALAYLWLNEKLSGTPAGIAGEIISLVVMSTGVVVVAHRAPHLAPPVDATLPRLPSCGRASMPVVRFGLIILADQRWQQSARRWRLAEEYGFDHAWTYDHLGWRSLVDGPWFDAVPTLTAAATVTSRIRLGTLVASPNFRHPVSFLRQLTALDDISEGRIVLGLGAGAGGTSFDAKVLGEPELTPRQRADRYAEFAELLDLLLRADHVTWAGTYYRAVDARNLPGCVQRPRIPFVMAANGKRSMALAARISDGWVTTGSQTDEPAAWWRGVGDGVRRFADAVAAAGSEHDQMPRFLSLDAAGVYALSSADYFAEAAGRAEELGFTDVVTHWPRPGDPYAGDESVLETVAADVVPARQTTPG